MVFDNQSSINQVYQADNWPKGVKVRPYVKKQLRSSQFSNEQLSHRPTDWSHKVNHSQDVSSLQSYSLYDHFNNYSHSYQRRNQFGLSQPHGHYGRQSHIHHAQLDRRPQLHNHHNSPCREHCHTTVIPVNQDFARTTVIVCTEHGNSIPKGHKIDLAVKDADIKI